ncbi:MAG: aminopeptidase P family protein [Synergistaceae bacterium]|nr:aminopeptidase P family protein [Synergistaceae bacterium]
MGFDRINERVAKLRENISKQSLDAFVLFVNENQNSESCRYISGFSGSSAALLIDQKRALLISDGRYKKQAQDQSPFEFILQGRFMEKDAVKIISESNYKCVGFEAEKISHYIYKNCLAKHPIRWEDASSMIPLLRRTKDMVEVSSIVKAGKIAFEAYLTTLKETFAGMTEREFENLLLYKIRQMGGEKGWTHDDFIVASGKRGVLPHGRATNKKFELGDVVTVDFGVTVDGYMCDVTRNFCIGKPSQMTEEINELLSRANRQAAKALAPSEPGKRIDDIARRIITDAGYGKQFSHGLGHGLGLEVHEPPRLSPVSGDVLAIGDVVTIEPGVYIEGWGGMRIEDDYLITEEGAVCLTGDCDHSLRIVE